MGINNINTEAAGKFLEEAKSDPELTKKVKKVEGEWVFDEGKPQFRSTLAFMNGESTVESDFAPFMGGSGVAPDPIQYCLFGMAACYAGTFVSLAAMEGIELSSVKVAAENRVDLSRSLGLSDNPIVEEVKITLNVVSGASREKLEELEKLTKERCPGVYCLTNPIPLETVLEISS